MCDHQLGVHICRQQALLGRFITDFSCAQARLCIEIDGDTHAEPGQEQYDAARTARLNEMGYRVIRFTDEEVARNLPAVWEAIQEAREEHTPPPAL